jgi:hypothetical protein
VIDRDATQNGALTQNAVHYAILGGIDDGDDSDWRVTVNLVLGLWRFERFSGIAKEWTRYESIDSIQGGDARIEYARENSERQRRQKAAARVRVHRK